MKVLRNTKWKRIARTTKKGEKWGGIIGVAPIRFRYASKLFLLLTVVQLLVEIFFSES